MIATIQSGVPVARIELLDEARIGRGRGYSKLAAGSAPTAASSSSTAPGRGGGTGREVKEFAAEQGGTEFRWAATPEERSKLWQARHDAHYAAMALRPGARVWATDVCVPISRLAECIAETEADLDRSSLIGAMVGHVGDGNFHVALLDRSRDEPEEIAEAGRLNDRLVQRAIAMDGTCTGEHGVGYGKMNFLIAEHGDAIAVMRSLKRALDPDTIMNPGKIIRV